MTRRSLAGGLLAASLAACASPQGTRVRLTGVVQATPIVVSSPVSGRIANVAVEVGQEVASGEPLAALDTAGIQEKIRLLEGQVSVIEARWRSARTLGELEVRRAGETRESASAQLDIAARQRDRARKTMEEYDRNPPHVRRRVEAGRVVEERNDFGRLQVEWADARLSFFELQALAVENAIREAESARRAAEVRAKTEANPWAVELLEHRHRLNEARRMLEDHVIRAAGDAMVSVRVREAGEFVERGDPIVVLYDPEELWVGVSVEESIVDRFDEGDRAPVELPNGRRIQTIVESVSPAAGFVTQRDVDRVRRDIRAFRLKLKLPEDARARPGMTAYVHIRE